MYLNSTMMDLPKGEFFSVWGFGPHRVEYNLTTQEEIDRYFYNIMHLKVFNFVSSVQYSTIGHYRDRERIPLYFETLIKDKVLSIIEKNYNGKKEIFCEYSLIDHGEVVGLSNIEIFYQLTFDSIIVYQTVNNIFLEKDLLDNNKEVIRIHTKHIMKFEYRLEEFSYSIDNGVSYLY